MDSQTLRRPIEELNPRKPICVRTGTTVAEAIRKMKAYDIGCVCVVNPEKKLCGILTERDVLTKVVGGNVDPEAVRVEDVMTHNPEYLFLDDQMAFALNRMHVGGFRHVPLTDLNGTPSAVISVRDIVRHLLKSAEGQS